MRKEKTQNTYTDVNLIPFSLMRLARVTLPISLFFPSFAASNIRGIPENSVREKERERETDCYTEYKTKLSLTRAASP